MARSRTRTLSLFFAFIVAAGLALSTCWSWGQAQDGGPPPPPPPPRSADGDQPGPATRPGTLAGNHHAPAPATRPLSPLAAGERRVPIKIEGGHDTDRRDHGRPVALIAAALTVPDAVFRETFSHVHPAGPGSGGPTDAEARQNKAALMKGLSPYGVTDDRINTVSNYYRYMKRNHDDLWQHREAVAFAVVNADGKVVRFDLPDSGAGYTTPPKVTIAELPGITVIAKLKFGTDLTTNGSIESLTAGTPTTAPGH